MFGETISELPGYSKRNTALRIYQMLILNLHSNGEENLKEVTIPKHHLNFASPSALSLLVQKLLSIMLLISLLVVVFVSLTVDVEEAHCSPGIATHLVKQAVGNTYVIEPAVDIELLGN